MKKQSPYVLVMGYRKELAKTIEKLGFPYSIVTNKPLKKTPTKVDHIIDCDFTQQVIAEIENLKIRPTHVIVGVEAAVYMASIVRKYFGARMSELTLVRRCSNKSEMKRYLFDKAVPLTPFIVSKGSESAEEIIEKLSLPVVVKTVEGSGGRNLVFCKTKDMLKKHMGKGLIYEKFVDAPEGSIESFVNNGEILFTNVTEYYVKGFCNILPATYPEEEIKSLLDFNSQVLKLLKISWGLTHLEFYRHPDGVLFGEIAIRPPGGYIMTLIKKSYGFNPWEALVHIEMDQPFQFPKKETQYAACWVHHPGPGKAKIKDVTAPLQSLIKHKIKVKDGQPILPRKSVGEDVGYSLFASPDPTELKKDLDRTEVRSLVTVG